MHAVTLVNGSHNLGLDALDRGLAYGDGVFETIDILKNVRRVTDAQYGDFDNDGDLDLAATFPGLVAISCV